METQGASSIEPHVLEHVWLITNLPLATSKWNMSPAFEQRNPLQTVYVVFADFGFLTYYEVKALNPPRLVTRDMLKPLPKQLMLPWEVEPDFVAPGFPGTLPELLWNARKDLSLHSEALTTDPLERQARAYADEMWFLKTGKRPHRVDEMEPPLLHLNEEDTIRMLIQTPRDKARLEDGTLWSVPTAEDVRCFMDRHKVRLEQGPRAFPSIVFTVPYEEYPVGPMYRGLVARLSYKDVPHWLHAREQRTKVALQERARVELYDECAGDFTRVMGGRLALLWERYHTETAAYVPVGTEAAVSGYKRNTSTTTAVSDIKDTQDIEDLIGKSPPCVAALLNQKRWYKDKERTQLLYQLKTGGATEELVARVFERAESHARGDDGSWNYMYAWRNQESFAQSCRTLIQNTTTTTPNAAPCIRCVYAKEDDPRGRCLQEMQRRFPAKRLRYLNFPHQWYTATNGSVCGGK